MAYTDKRGLDGGKISSMIIVGLVTALILYLLVAVNYDRLKKIADDTKVFDVEPPPPPPKKLPPPPPKQDLPPPPVTRVPPIVQPPSAAPVPQPTYQPPAPPPPVHYDPPPAPTPTPPPVIVPVRVTPRGNAGGWVTNDDYPPGAQREGKEGVTGFRLDVGPDGRVTNCSVTSSSGSSDLDGTACKLLMRRARFNPGKDSSGNPTGGVYSSRIRWQVEK